MNTIKHVDKLRESRILEAIDFGVRQTDFTQRFWTVNPIDGTKGFLRGEQYAIALALVENGKVMLGVLGYPNYSMELRKGTFLFDLLKSADYELNSDHCE